MKKLHLAITLLLALGCIALALEVRSLQYSLKTQIQINQSTQALIDNGALIPHVITHEYGARLGTNHTTVTATNK